MNTSVSEAAHVLAGYDALDDVDLIHDHTVLGPLLSARLGVTRVPVVTTVHGAFDDRMRRIAAESARHAGRGDEGRRGSPGPAGASVHGPE